MLRLAARAKAPDWLAAGAIAIASAAAIFHHLGFSLWFDEADSFGLATEPLGLIVRQYLWGGESNMTLYYGVLRLWLAITGAFGIAPSEVVMRLPTAIFGMATAVVVYALGRRLFGRVAGLIAGLVYLTSFLQIILAQTARAYTLQLLLLSLFAYALIRGLESTAASSRWWTLSVISGALAVYAQLFSGLVIASLFAGVVAVSVFSGPWADRVRSNARALLLSGLAIVLLILPIAIDAAVHGGPVWVPPAHLHDLRTFMHDFISGGSRRYELVVFSILALGLLLALLSRLTNSTRRLSDFDATIHAPAILLGFWFAGPIALSFALTQQRVNLHLFFPRYLVVVVPPLALLVGLGVSALRWRAAQAILGVAVAAVAVPVLLSYYQYAQVQDFRTVSQWVEARYHSGDGIACDPAVECAIPFSYYLAARPGPAHFDPDSPGRFIWDGTRSQPLSDAAVQDYASQHTRLFLVYGPLGRSPDRTRELEHLKALLAAQFEIAEQVTAPGSSVDLSAYLYRRKS